MAFPFVVPKLDAIVLAVNHKNRLFCLDCIFLYDRVDLIMEDNLTELEDVKSMRLILDGAVKQAGSYEAAAVKLSSKRASFSADLIRKACKGVRGISKDLAKALGYEKIVKYRKVK